ncbi:MAG: DUF4118 domain-containing protein, partial [Candidatus Limnocylindrales bacterium]
VRDHVAPVNIALLLVLLVLLGAVIGGRRAGVLSAIAAAMSFDFFQTKPYNSLKISSSADVQTTILLLAVGIAIGEIASRADRIRSVTRDHHQGLARVHRVAQLAARGESVDDLVSALCAELIESLRREDCSFERPPLARDLPRIESTGAVTATEHFYTADGFELPRDGVALPVSGGGRTIGRFVLVPTPGTGIDVDHRLVAVALADQLGIVLAQSVA